MPTPQTLALLAGAAFVAGFCDAIAGGGGLVTVPALLAVGLPPQVALATNKGQAVFGAVASAATFARKKGLDLARAPLRFALGAAGSLVGAFVLGLVDPKPLKGVVLALLGVAATLLLFKPPAPPTQRPPVPPRAGALAVALVALGFYDGFFGPGTGSLLIVAFGYLGGDDLLRASGNAKVVNLASNVAAFGLFAAKGAILWPIALPMAAANVLGASLGARVALRGGARLVRGVVLAVLTVLVTKVVWDLVVR